MLRSNLGSSKIIKQRMMLEDERGQYKSNKGQSMFGFLG